MISSLILKLRNRNGPGFQNIYPNLVNAWVYESIRQTEEGSLYHDSQASPFALKRLSRDKDGSLVVHLVFLDYTMFMEFYRTLMKDSLVRLGKETFEPVLAAIHPADHPLAGLLTYEQFGHLAVSKRFLIEFRHTAFKQQQKTFVLPVPLQIIKNLFVKWNRFSSVPFVHDDETVLIQELASGLLITSHHIRTRLYTVSPYIKLTTFSGRVIASIIHEELRIQKMLNTLLQFAHYSGIGWKCAYGMGSVDITPLAAGLSSREGGTDHPVSKS